MDSNTVPNTALDGLKIEWLEIVREKVAKLRFGSVQITVHEGRVILVENTEKIRIVVPTKKDPTKNARS